MSDVNQRLQEYLANGTQELRTFLENGVVTKNDRELERIEAYYLYLKFYNGYHYKDFNHAMITFNYVKAFIDKVNLFLLGDSGFSFQVVSLYNDNLKPEITKPIEELILYNWRRNNKSIIAHEMLQMGSITGDVWVMVSWEQIKKYCKLTVLDSRQVFPIFNNGDYNDLAGIQVRQILETNPRMTNSKEVYKLKVTYYTKDSVEVWYQKSVGIETPIVNIYKSGFINDIQNYTKQENPLGFIPIVHIKNRPSSDSYFGKSDAHDILKLNKVYNEMNQEMKGIIDYYATPTTVVTGATLKNMKRGLGNIWSGLPPEANVFTLGLDADLSSMTTFIQQLKTGMHEISDVPEQVLGKIQSISGTSAAALKLTFQPLVQQADLKSMTYGEGIAELNEMMIKILFTYDKKNPRLEQFTWDDEANDLRIEPVFSYGFPSDRMNTLQEAQMEFQMGLASKEEIMNRLGKNNVTDLLQKIDEELIQSAEIQAQVMEITTPPVQDVNIPQ